MINQSIDELLKNIDNRYYLVAAVAKRARVLSINKEGEMTCSFDEALSRAVEEIASGKVKVNYANKKR